MVIPCDRLSLDQAAYIESTKDGGVDRRVNDGIAHDKLDAIIAALGGTSAGTPYFREVQSVTTPGVLQILFSEVVTAATALKLKSVRLTSRQSISYNIFIDTVIVGSGRTGSGILNDDFIFTVEREALTGSTLKVEIISNSGRPATDVELYIQALET